MSLRIGVYTTGEGNSNPLQNSCPEDPMDGGAWWSNSQRRRKELDTAEQLTQHLVFAVCLVLMLNESQELEKILQL